MYNNVQRHLEISSLKKVSPKYSPFYSFPERIDEQLHNSCSNMLKRSFLVLISSSWMFKQRKHKRLIDIVAFKISYPFLGEKHVISRNVQIYQGPINFSISLLSVLIRWRNLLPSLFCFEVECFHWSIGWYM